MQRAHSHKTERDCLSRRHEGIVATPCALEEPELRLLIEARLLTLHRECWHASLMLQLVLLQFRAGCHQKSKELRRGPACRSPNGVWRKASPVLCTEVVQPSLPHCWRRRPPKNAAPPLAGNRGASGAGSTLIGQTSPGAHVPCLQESRGLLPADDEGGGGQGGRRTAVAVAIAKLGEPAVVAGFTGGGSFVGTGRALSAAAGRLSYFYGLKVPHIPSLNAMSTPVALRWKRGSRGPLARPWPHLRPLIKLELKTTGPVLCFVRVPESVLKC